MSGLTIEQVQQRVKEIGEKGESDYEAAHSDEDRLYEEVLRTIAELPGRAGKLAAAALESKRFEFARHTE
jgi:hypothetical protein